MPIQRAKLKRTPRDADSRLAQASAEYEKLAASVYELGAQIAALGSTIQGTSSHAAVPLTRELTGGATQTAPMLDDRGSRVIEVHLLGPFAIYVGGRNVVPACPAQVQTVLKFVLSQRSRPVSKDALLDLLWPESDPAVTGSRLRVLMHTLRRCITCTELGFRDLVLLSGNNFIVNPQAHVWVDVDEFERCWLDGWRYSRAGRTTEALHEYERAEILYTGDYLEDDPYADWTLLRREALRDAHSTILTMLASMSLESGDHTGAIIWAQKLLAQDSCREDAYRLLMRSHQKLGQMNRALHWYSMCARSLERELNMEPSEETQTLFRVLSGALAEG